ncbi:Gfo/Idh/MocA family oxidoreductase [Paucibacter sp. R3-3]|uniref:Gfo/Idh/MocA family oxidoreductase n=1 Tax=Roseateles agri TaxID=3098619 RepID=A0ABU5DC06_9BURK|nr:Gfo/Idh/MocA family oxidoreductase [Paucibacter sp. R3-3]MDY0743811.1 Gfo/Idh/MocA family oxidoreductase [Paucibacter sp. R3-3]
MTIASPNLNPVIALLGRRLRLAVIGGGPGSFIGAMHRQAARLDDGYELVAAALSSDPEKSVQAGVSLGLPAERAYASGLALLQAEAQRTDGADVIAIMTPNDSHFELSVTALKLGFDVICDKPMTNTLAEARELHAVQQQSGRVFCLTHNYTGYPMVRQARAMVEAGELGELRLMQVEYVQGGRADESIPPGQNKKRWKEDGRGGPSLVMGDIGTHAHNLLRFVSGLEVAEVAAEIGPIVPGRVVHDYAGAMLRMEGGARGSFWVTQTAAGVENCLRLRISGNRGTLEWMQEVPQELLFKPLGAPQQKRTPNGPGTLPFAARSCRIVAGHPEGFHEGFANLYKDAGEAIAARRAGAAPDPLALHFPNALDGLRGVEFVDAVMRSSEANGAWMKPGA